MIYYRNIMNKMKKIIQQYNLYKYQNNMINQQFQNKYNKNKMIIKIKKNYNHFCLNYHKVLYNTIYKIMQLNNKYKKKI